MEGCLDAKRLNYIYKEMIKLKWRRERPLMNGDWLCKALKNNKINHFSKYVAYRSVYQFANRVKRPKAKRCKKYSVKSVRASMS